MICDHGVNAKYCRACKIASDKKRSLDDMTGEQLQNWRNALIPELGAVAILMPRNHVIAYAKRIQNAINKEIENGT